MSPPPHRGLPEAGRRCPTSLCVCSTCQSARSTKEHLWKGKEIEKNILTLNERLTDKMTCNTGPSPSFQLTLPFLLSLSANQQSSACEVPPSGAPGEISVRSKRNLHFIFPLCKSNLPSVLSPTFSFPLFPTVFQAGSKAQRGCKEVVTKGQSDELFFTKLQWETLDALSHS